MCNQKSFARVVTMTVFAWIILNGYQAPVNANFNTGIPGNIQENSLYLPQHQVDFTEFPMVPLEADIEDFPDPLSEDDSAIWSDPEWGEYYSQVALAYEKWKDHQKNMAYLYKEKIQKQKEQAFLGKVSETGYASSFWGKKDGVSQSARQLTHRYIQEARLHDLEAQVAEQKAAFYQDLSENIKTLN